VFTNGQQIFRAILSTFDGGSRLFANAAEQAATNKPLAKSSSRATQ
jgi:hypothetical protein